MCQARTEGSTVFFISELLRVHKRGPSSWLLTGPKTYPWARAKGLGKSLRFNVKTGLAKTSSVRPTSWEWLEWEGVLKD
jgi:hypothetical protein